MKNMLSCVVALSLLWGASAVEGAIIEIQAQSITFSPDTVDIFEGDTIRWVQVTGVHTTTSGTGSADPQVGVLWDEVLDGVNTTFERPFNTIGMFPFFCRPHEGLGMKGAIIVSAKPASLTEITTGNNFFSSDSVNILVGGAVRWVWTAGVHTTTSGLHSSDPQLAVLWDEALDNSNPSFTYTFDTAGVFPYFCRPHEFIGMKGVVVVENPPGLEQVVVASNTFTSDSINILTGDSVRWVWTEGVHTTTSGEGSGDAQAGTLWDEPLDPNNTSYTHTFDAAGVFPYFCIPHELLGMDGVVVVTDPPDCACDCQGDESCDSVANVFDVVFVVGEAFRSEPLTPDPNQTCPLVGMNDVNLDGFVNVFDVVFIVNMAFRNGMREDNVCDPCTLTGPANCPFQ